MVPSVRVYATEIPILVDVNMTKAEILLLQWLERALRLPREVVKMIVQKLRLRLTQQRRRGPYVERVIPFNFDWRGLNIDFLIPILQESGPEVDPSRQGAISGAFTRFFSNLTWRGRLNDFPREYDSYLNRTAPRRYYGPGY